MTATASILMKDNAVRGLLVAALLGLTASNGMAASTPEQDKLVSSYFAIWDDDGNVTPANVERLYAWSSTYYGHAMTRQSLLRDKLSFIRRWPDRRYEVEPGSASKICDASEDHCRITVTLRWRTSGASGTRAGRSRVSLILAREDGALKIVREGGVTLSR